MKNISFVFFGSTPFSIVILEELKKAGFVPELLVATPDKPKGRKLVMTPPPAKAWALEHAIPVVQPEKLKDLAFVQLLKEQNWDVFIVASYGKIIPQEILDMPAHKTLNVHPSLLPKYRGASPLESAILADDKNTGVSIMRLDEEMDHGPIVAQEKNTIEAWPPTALKLEETLGQAGGALLAKILPDWIEGKIKEQPQEHDKATYTKKIEKTAGEINLVEDAYKNFLKIQAFAEWPGTYYFVEKDGKKIRVVIKKAEYDQKEKKLTLLRVIPEGKQEMEYKDFSKGYVN